MRVWFRRQKANYIRCEDNWDDGICNDTRSNSIDRTEINDFIELTIVIEDDVWTIRNDMLSPEKKKLEREILRTISSRAYIARKRIMYLVMRVREW